MAYAFRRSVQPTFVFDSTVRCGGSTASPSRGTAGGAALLGGGRRAGDSADGQGRGESERAEVHAHRTEGEGLGWFQL